MLQFRPSLAIRGYRIFFGKLVAIQTQNANQRTTLLMIYYGNFMGFNGVYLAVWSTGTSHHHMTGMNKRVMPCCNSSESSTQIHIFTYDSYMGLSIVMGVLQQMLGLSGESHSNGNDCHTTAPSHTSIRKRVHRPRMILMVI